MEEHLIKDFFVIHHFGLLFSVEYVCPHLIIFCCCVVQGDQKVSVHLMITIQKVTSNVRSVPCQSPDIY